uniref:Uncharacterized protein n=1 Tax=Aegilops tauschii subsp. strangulata TaxID=200361 RepID=A0A453IID0_AEGTS
DAATGGDLRRLRGEQSPVAPTSQESRRARPRGALSPRCGVAFARVLAGMGSAHAREELASGKDAEEKAWLADVSIQGVGPFQAAARLGKVDVCRCLVEELGFDINAGSKIGHHEAARLLLSRGASVDIAYFHGTPLHIAAYYGKASVMKVLLEHHADAGADVNSTNPDTALVVVTTYGLTDCIKYLLKAGADPNIPNSHCGAMPIQIAASCGRRKHVELLFPLTSPIRTISNWTVDGILANAKSKHSKPRCGQRTETRKRILKE